MNRIFLLGLVAVMSATAQAGRWDYKISQDEMGDVSRMAVLQSEPKKNGKTASIDITPMMWVTLPENLGVCGTKCLIEFRLDGEKVSTIDYYQLSYLPTFRIDDLNLLERIISAKEIKLRVGNLSSLKTSEVYTFKPSEPYDPQKIKDLTLNK